MAACLVPACGRGATGVGSGCRAVAGLLPGMLLTSPSASFRFFCRGSFAALPGLAGAPVAAAAACCSSWRAGSLTRLLARCSSAAAGLHMVHNMWTPELRCNASAFHTSQAGHQQWLSRLRGAAMKSNADSDESMR